MLSFRGGINLKEYGSFAAVSEGACRLTYLLDVVFSDYPVYGAVPNPLPGRVGQLTLVENDGQYSTDGTYLTNIAQGTPVTGDLYIYDAVALNRAAGNVILLTNMTLTLGFSRWGLDTNNIPTGVWDHQFYRRSGIPISDLDWYSGANNIAVASHDHDVEYSLLIVQRNIGAFGYIKGGAYTNWILLWVDDAGEDLTTFIIFSLFTSTEQTKLIRAASLADNDTCPTPELGTRDLDLSVPGTGSGTSSIAVPALGNTYVHTPDTVITYDLTSLSGAAGIYAYFRQQDATNYWTTRAMNDGTFRLDEIIGGVNNVRAGTGVGTLVGGERITLIANDETITGFYDDNLAWTYALATNFKTETDGYISLGAAPPAVIANLEARTLDGIANLASSNHPGYGLATDVLPGPRAAADTFVHEADCIFEFINIAISPTQNTNVQFRYQDATHNWTLRITAAGNLDLYEYDGLLNLRSTAAGVLVGGERITIVAEGSTIKGYYDTTLAWTYAAAVNFSTETSGFIWTMGANGEISDLISWPRYLSASTGPELLVDGDMEAATTAAWTINSGAVLSKETGTPHSGLRVLRVATNPGDPVSQARQNILTLGKRYHVSGYVRSDGVAQPNILAGTTQIWSGTTSTNWQAIDFLFVQSDAVNPSYFLLGTIGDTQYCEFDDCSVTEITYGAPNTPGAANVETAFNRMATA